MTKKRNTVNYLPEDLVLDILSRVPAVSLIRLRSTSKEWNALVKDERLAKKHFASAPKQSPLVIMLIAFRVYLMNVSLHGIEKVDLSAYVTCQFSLKDPLSNNASEEVDIREVFHCDGLLLCSTKDNRLVVWNPCSGETSWIQPKSSYKKSDVYALGYDNRSSCYKILRMDRSEYRIPIKTECQVYDFTSKSWWIVDETGDWFISDIGSRRHGLSVKGNTYWLVLTQDGPPFVLFLLCFDFSTEKFRSLSLPSDAPTYYGVSLSVTREEPQLCLFSTHGSEVWIATKMESTEGITWSKSRRFHISIEMTVSVDHEKNVFVHCYERRSKNMLHIVGKDIDIIQMDQHVADSTCPLLLTYVPTLVQIQHRT